MLVLLGNVEESGHKHLIEGEAWNVTACVDTEAVNTHFDKRAVAVDQIFGGGWVLGVEVHAVAGYLRIPASVVVPVKLSEMVPIVVRVVILFVGIFHQSQSTVVLHSWNQIGVVVGEFSSVLLGERSHTRVNQILVGAPVAGKLLAEVFLAKVTGVVEHNVEHDFHSTLVRLVDQGLETHVLALVAMIHLAEIAGVIAVVVEARSVFHHRCHPNGGEPQCLDVVKFFDKPLEVAAPSRVAVHRGWCVPALGIVARVAIIESGSDHEIDTFVAKVGSAAHKSRLHGSKAKANQCEQGKSLTGK